MKATIFIEGQTPSKKNSKQIVLPGDGRRRIISSEFYAAWEKKALRRLRKHELVGHKWQYPLRAGFRYVREGNHRFDYNNLNQGVLDILVKVGILEDDSMKHIIPNGEHGYEVDKSRPGVYISLEEIEEAADGHTRAEDIVRPFALSAQTAPRKPGKSPESTEEVATHPQSDEHLSMPLVRGGVVTGKPAYRTKARKTR